MKCIFGIGSRAVQAWGCVRCRNLQFTVEFSERDLERYQEFEGEQPDVLERINSNPKKLEGQRITEFKHSSLGVYVFFVIRIGSGALFSFVP